MVPACRSTSPAMPAGDLRITNTAAFGGIGDDYMVKGATGDNEPLESLEIPSSYNWLPDSNLASAVLELANLYAAFTKDLAEGTHRAPTFEGAVWLHRLFDDFETSNTKGVRLSVE